MASETDATADSGATAPAVSEIEIKRDRAFTRYFADTIAVHDHGSFQDLMLIVQGPDPKMQLVADRPEGLQPQEIRLEASFTEVARVRIAPHTGASLAMMLLERSLEANRISIPAFRESMLQMLDHFESQGKARAAGPRDDEVFDEEGQ